MVVTSSFRRYELLEKMKIQQDEGRESEAGDHNLILPKLFLN